MRLVIIGGGGHAAVVAEAAEAQGHELVGFVDDDLKRRVGVLPHLGPIVTIWGRDSGIAGAVLGIGSFLLRRNWLEQSVLHGLSTPPIVHPRAWVSPSAKLSVGVVVMAGAIVQARAEVGSGTIVNTGASVDHDCRVGAYAHIAPGARLAGEVMVGDDCVIGMMSCVIEGLRVGTGALVAAGAVVVKDIPPGARFAGVPARPMRNLESPR